MRAESSVDHPMLQLLSTGRKDGEGRAVAGAAPRDADGLGVALPFATTIHGSPDTGVPEADVAGVADARPSAPQPLSTTGNAASPSTIFVSRIHPPVRSMSPSDRPGTPLA